MKALVFPGQGSQSVGMCRDLYETVPTVRDTYTEAAAVLGYDIATLSFEGPVEQLSQTDVTQPALLVAEVATLRAARERGLVFDCALGHSLGEYTALVAAGALSFGAAVDLVRRRGAAMQAAATRHPGGMLAVLGLDDEVVEGLCDAVDGTWPANYNCPGQVVVSGTAEGLEAMAGRAVQAGARKVVRLPVSGAFHSPHMAAAAAELAPALEQAEWSAPARRFFSVSTVGFFDGGRPPSFAALLTGQITAPVRFTQAVRALVAAGCDAFLEVGPGAVLSGLIKRITRDATVDRVGDAETLAALADGWVGR
ncbi:MAG: ACP S-malonyltransferase [Actinobacteria bacterium]|nr:ACP S-malonyltransferase [Actinomycetota bacterium]